MKINFLKKGSILLVSFFFLFIFLFLVNATTISETQVVGVTVEVPTSPTNYSTITVNNSDYTEHWITSEGVLGDVADISHSWLDDLAWSVAGHTIDTDFLPDSTLSYDIGSGASRWDWLYVRNISTENIEVSENLIINNLCNSTNCYTLSNLLTGSGGISPWLNTSDYLYIDSDYPQHINISGNASFGGGGIFSGAILADDTVGYENIRFGVFAHTPRILFDNGSNVGQIDYVGETIRFILNETGVGNRATMRINSSTVRIGATGSRRDLYLYGNIIGVNPAGGGANIQMDGAISSATSTFSTEGPTDNVDVSKINTLFVDTSSNDITIGGLAGGVVGQYLQIVKVSYLNDLTLEHNEKGGSQDLMMHQEANEIIDAGGVLLVCNGTDWWDVSHAKHV